MVAAISTTPRISKTPSSSASPSTPHRPPLSPSHKTSTTNNNNSNKNNNADEIPRKPINRNIPSRYLHSPSPPPSPPSSTSSSSSSSSSAQSPRPMSSNSSMTSTTTTRSLSVSFQGHSFSFQTTKPKPITQNPPKKTKSPSNSLASKTRNPNSLTRSLDCSIEKKGSIVVVFDDPYLTSDSNSCNSVKGPAPTRGISVPARFWPENFSPGMKSRGSSSSMKRLDSASLQGQQGNVQYSILSFGVAEARRAKKGESRIEEAHSLRLLYNRYLQWRCVNAQADAAILVQRANTEKNLFDAWLTTSQLRDSVTSKQTELQLLLQKLKLDSILKEQMIYLEEWSLMDKEHCNYLSGLIEALKASTFRLPVVSGARVDFQELQNAVNSAVDVMQAMGSSICSLLPKVEGTSALVSELAKAAAHEQALLNQSKDLLSTVAAMHVKQCSLRGHILQLNRNLNQ